MPEALLNQESSIGCDYNQLNQNKKSAMNNINIDSKAKLNLKKNIAPKQPIMINNGNQVKTQNNNCNKNKNDDCKHENDKSKSQTMNRSKCDNAGNNKVIGDTNNDNDSDSDNDSQDSQDSEIETWKQQRINNIAKNGCY